MLMVLLFLAMTRHPLLLLWFLLPWQTVISHPLPLRYLLRRLCPLRVIERIDPMLRVSVKMDCATQRP